MMQESQKIKIVYHVYMLVLLTISAVVLYQQTVPLRAIRDIVPQDVKSDLTVNGYPAIKIGDSIKIEGEKCNDSNVDIYVTGGYHYRRVDVVTFLDGADGFTVRSPGCKIYNYAHEMPKDMVAGLWIVEGYDKLAMNGQEQVVPWYSEPFLVIE